MPLVPDRFRLWLIPSLGALILAGCSTDPLSELELVWEDNFDGPAGQLPNPANWAFDIGTGQNGWGNNQLEYNTDRPENVSLDGAGNLAITAREEDFQGSAYTSGRINTSGLFSQARGRFEARIKLPVGQGIWPAFWMLGDSFETVGWPACGEIDIMEFRGQQPKVVLGTVHGPGYSGGDSIGGSTRLVGAGLDEDFHVYAVEWSDNNVTWLLDDERYFTVSRENIPRASEWVFDDPFFLLLNVAVGGNFVGPPDDTTEFPQTMLVDYVRVYRSES